jgi:hypothetical protein
MKKSLLTGMAVCAAMGAFAANAYAIEKHPVHRHPIRTADRIPETRIPEIDRPGYPTQFRIPAHPLVWDCVHVLFPQCSRGYDGLNDGSFK